ncbi:MAG: pantoate--beta-alanine ligase, partial [Candidatus Omnitrophota bacterium]
KMYLGQKDAQQALVIKKMINDLNLDVKLRVCPIIREKDGLALSSRNKHLSVDQRRESIILYKSLKRARQRIKDGEKKTKIIIDLIAQNISNHSQGIVEYIVCVDEKNLEDVKNIEKKVLIALAIKFGSTRLIDNIIIKS